MSNYQKFIRDQVPDHYSAIIDAVTPFIGANTEPCEETAMPVGRSKFCGEPDLPRGFQWPMSCDGPCHFVAQLNLAELALFETAHPLPPDGLLSFFFHDAEGHPEGANSVVYYFSEPHHLERTAISVDPRFGEEFHEEHLYSRCFSFAQAYVIEEDELPNSFELRSFIDSFEFHFGRATHRLFGASQFDGFLTLGSFGEWSDRINFLVPIFDFNVLDFSMLEVEFHCS
ncbi:MAG: DUF1963 domain-containing protein [Planctomycetota bacterium]